MKNVAISAAIAAIQAASTVAAQLPPIHAYGQHFFYQNGSQFFMRGVAYQQGYGGNGTTLNGGTKYVDPLADSASCSRDIPYLKQLQTNVIRTYAINPAADHSACMQMLNDAGIYVISDLSEPATSIQSNDPQWNTELYQRYTSVVDALANYTNVIGFFAGNEVSSMYNQTGANAFVKAAVRDTKAYIASKGYRSGLGVGYATADVPGRNELAYYYACGDPASQIDFWGYNVYSWCGQSSYTQSSYDERVQFFSSYNKPAFFAEYGCTNIPGGAAARPFDEVQALYGSNMTGVFSGGIVYMYFQESNDYGLVSVSGSSVSTLADFNSLSSQLAKISPSSTMSSAYSPTNSAPACPTVGVSGADTWLAAATPLPPTPNNALCNCEVAAGSCNVGTTDATKYGDVFNYICGRPGNYCAGIARNGTTGNYGAISGCDSAQQLAFVMNQYYVGNGRSSSACAFNGVGSIQSASTAGTCSSLLQQAGPSGLGSVAAPTGAQASLSSSKGAASGLAAPAFFNFGGVFLGAYVALAAVSSVALLVI